MAITYDVQLGLAVTGQFQNTATFGTTNVTAKGLYDVFVARYDLSGNNMWAKRGGGYSINGDEGKGISTDGNGNIYVSGNVSGLADFGSLQIMSGPDSNYADIFIAKVDSNGNALWIHHGGGEHNDEARGIATDAQGNSYVTGQVESPFATFDTITLEPFGNEAVFLAKYNSNGAVQFVKRYAAGIGVGISLLDNGCMAFCGSASGQIGVPIFDTAAFYYVDRNGFVGKFCDEFIPTNTTDVSANANELILYPNPTSSQLKLQFNNSYQVVYITVYNSLLQEVLSTRPFTENNNLDVSQLPSGIYYLKAFVDDKTEVKRFVMMK